MLDKQKDIDAVVIATPDHTHAVITMAAMAAGKHVYCQEPLIHTVKEARVITEAARRYKVQTQMGNQGHSSEHIRLLKEWLADGAIGDVTEVYGWTERFSSADDVSRKKAQKDARTLICGCTRIDTQPGSPCGQEIQILLVSPCAFLRLTPRFVLHGAGSEPSAQS